MEFYLVKRDGSIVDFDKDLIALAIQKAMKVVRNIDPTFAKEKANEVFESLKEECEQFIDIEHVQDVVEDILMKSEYPEVAKEYVIYRESRRVERESMQDYYKRMQKKLTDIMMLKGIENSNANVDESSFSGKNDKAGNYILKQFALNNLMNPRIAEYHRKGVLYTHDLDKYASGMHNCLLVDFEDLFLNNGGFITRNGDVRRPGGIGSFFQLVAVVFQCASQCQYGGIGSAKIDSEAAPFVAITFKKCYIDAIMDIMDVNDKTAKQIVDNLEKSGIEVRLENEELIKSQPRIYKVAYRHTLRKTQQGAESLYHNLNTLESRAGSQVPFTSINFGKNTTPEGRMVTKCLLEASLDGIGKFYRTSIFPISIFQYHSKINGLPGTPNYDLYQLSIKSLTKRIYPNIVNVEAREAMNGSGDTMGCRTMLGDDRFGLKGGEGRGNISPVTMNLVDIGIRNGICLGERKKADIKGFWKDLDTLLNDAEFALLDRYEWIASQPAKSGFFTYMNGLMKNTLGRKLMPEEEVRECIKHGSLAIGYIGIAEAMVAMFGETHTHNKEVYDFAYSVVEHIYNFTKEASERNNLNFSCYATPAEGSCSTLRDLLVERYGIIEGVTDREYLTNSHHIPVYDEVSIFKKLELEAPFAKLATGGNICYVELESSVVNNPKAIEKIIKYAMGLGITYLAFNFPIDTCLTCGYSAEMGESCPICHSDNIERLRRVTGYITTDYHKFNKGKIAEVHDRVKHSKFTDNLVELYNSEE